MEAFKRLVLSVGMKQKWFIKRNGVDTSMRLDDLEGIKRLPFDAKQTLVCDQVRHGCFPITANKCINSSFRRGCHKMPIWENEAPFENRDFDKRQNDDDDYHENENDQVLFWEDVNPDKTSKVFFYEQLKIMAKYIRANSKIRTNREIFEREVSEWNDNYKTQFISKTVKIAGCPTPKEEQEKLLRPTAKCNKWGPWIRKNNCPKCGGVSRQVQRYCYNYNKSGNPVSLMFEAVSPGRSNFDMVVMHFHL